MKKNEILVLYEQHYDDPINFLGEITEDHLDDFINKYIKDNIYSYFNCEINIIEIKKDIDNVCIKAHMKFKNSDHPALEYWSFNIHKIVLDNVNSKI